MIHQLTYKISAVSALGAITMVVLSQSIMPVLSIVSLHLAFPTWWLACGLVGFSLMVLMIGVISEAIRSLKQPGMPRRSDSSQSRVGTADQSCKQAVDSSVSHKKFLFEVGKKHTVAELFETQKSCEECVDGPKLQGQVFIKNLLLCEEWASLEDRQASSEPVNMMNKLVGLNSYHMITGLDSCGNIELGTTSVSLTLSAPIFKALRQACDQQAPESTVIKFFMQEHTERYQLAQAEKAAAQVGLELERTVAQADAGTAAFNDLSAELACMLATSSPEKPLSRDPLVERTNTAIDDTFGSHENADHGFNR